MYILLVVITIFLVITLSIILILYCMGIWGSDNKKFHPDLLVNASSNPEKNMKEMAFSAVPELGVILQWKYDMSELSDRYADQFLFPVKVWKPTNGFDPDDPPNSTKMIGKTVIPGVVDYAFDTNFPNQDGLTGNTWQYQTTVDSTEFPGSGRYHIALAAQLDEKLKSDYSSPVLVDVTVISEAAVFVGSPFSAVTATSDFGTNLRLLFSQKVDKNATLDQVCWKIDFSSMGYYVMDYGLSYTQRNGVNIYEEGNYEIDITVDKDFPITGTIDPCCCISEDLLAFSSLMGVYYSTADGVADQDGSMTYYILIIGKFAPDIGWAGPPMPVLSGQVPLYTYKSVGGTCQSNGDIIGEKSMGEIVIIHQTGSKYRKMEVSCTGGCKYDSNISGGSAIQTEMTKCTDYINADVAPFTGGNTVNFTIEHDLTSVINYIVQWNVIESKFNDPAVTYTIYTDVNISTVNWNLPPGNYEPSAMMYIEQMDGGTYMPAQPLEAPDIEIEDPIECQAVSNLSINAKDYDRTWNSHILVNYDWPVQNDQIPELVMTLNDFPHTYVSSARYTPDAARPGSVIFPKSNVAGFNLEPGTMHTMVADVYKEGFSDDTECNLQNPKTSSIDYIYCKSDTDCSPYGETCDTSRNICV